MSDEQPAELSPEQKALRAVAAINGGANPASEAYTLANDFTDRHTGSLSAWLRGVFRRT